LGEGEFDGGGEGEFDGGGEGEVDGGGEGEVDGGGGGAEGGCLRQHSRSPEFVGKGKDWPLAHGRVESAQSGHGGHVVPTATHVSWSEAQQ